MAIVLHNTLSRKKEPFTPLVPGKLNLYVCGPTVYNFIHVGNARPLVFFDVVRRFFELKAYQVKFVLNYTDVDDKIIERAREEKIAWTEITAKYIAAYEADMQSLGIEKPTVQPKVSDHIPQIIKIIEGLIAQGMAYVVDGEVLYAVRKFAEYGKLSGKNIDDLLSGARVEVDNKKKDPLDFSLWKPQKAADEPAWDSPWGKGRPGWHIECSAMAIEYLGETFDIHGGGMDLMHPHHENEIAQSEGFTKKPFANVWLHNNMLTVSNEKMSKSLGNVFLTKDFIKKYLAETLKYLLLSGHYRSTIDFSEKHIRDAQAALHRFYSCKKRCETFIQEPPKVSHVSTEENKLREFSDSFDASWMAAMEDDLNTAKVMGIIFEYVRLVNTAVDRKGAVPTESLKKEVERFLAGMGRLAKVLNILGLPAVEFLSSLRNSIISDLGIDAAEIEKKIALRLEARATKDFATADSIRKELSEKKIELKDSPTGTEWDVVLT